MQQLLKKQAPTRVLLPAILRSKFTEPMSLNRLISSLKGIKNHEISMQIIIQSLKSSNKKRSFHKHRLITPKIPVVTPQHKIMQIRRSKRTTLKDHLKVHDKG